MRPPSSLPGNATCERLGDDASLALLTVTYAALRQNAGAIDEYLALAVEADRIAARSGDRAAHAAVGPDHIYALYPRGGWRSPGRSRRTSASGAAAT